MITEDQWKLIFDKLANSNKGLITICAEVNVAYSSARKELAENKELLDKYAQAKEDQADHLAEEIIELADNCQPNKDEINKARLKIDTRKWVAAKLKPKKYGDKVETTLKGDKDAPIQTVINVVVSGSRSTLNNES